VLMPTRNFAICHYSGASHCCSHINNTSLFLLLVCCSAQPHQEKKSKPLEQNRTILSANYRNPPKPHPRLLSSA
jgi:hypothetical protein